MVMLTVVKCTDYISHLLVRGWLVGIGTSIVGAVGSTGVYGLQRLNQNLECTSEIIVRRDAIIS